MNSDLSMTLPAPDAPSITIEAIEAWGSADRIFSGDEGSPVLLAQDHSHEGDAGHDSHGDDAHADDAHGHEGDAHAADDGHGEHHGDAHHPDHYVLPGGFPNFYTLIESALPGYEHHGPGREHHFDWYVGPMFAIIQAGLLLFVINRIVKRRSVDKPGKAQVALEALFKGLYDFFGGVIGPEHAKKYVPYVATLWVFILVNKVAGLVPGFFSPWAHFPAVFALGVVTFIWVNANAIAAGGLGHFLWHLCGSPSNTIGWAVAPLMFVLETIGTFIKPVSLSLRLWGNTLGEDKLLASFLGFGMVLFSILTGGSATPIWGLPLHFPFLFLGLLVSIIQSTVFAMLAAVYIATLLPHGHHDDHGDHAEGHGHEAAA